MTTQRNGGPDVIARLEADIRKAVQSAEGKAKLEDAGFSVTGISARDADESRRCGA